MTVSSRNEKVGILAYGSLIRDPGIEITPLITERIRVATPFGVEFGRFSKSRGGGPTVVPHSAGEPVDAEILVLPDGISLESAKDMVWRREVGQEGSGRPYAPKSSPDSVLVKDAPGFQGLLHVLYTDFNESGKIAKPTAEFLASAAVSSVPKAKIGRDGISYLMQVRASGVETRLTSGYEAKILRTTGSETLFQALAGLQGKMLERRFERALSDLAGASEAGGRLARIENNLIPGIQLEDFQADLLAGAGNELDGHFFSSRSSSALAVNSFAYFRKRPNELGMQEIRGVRSLCFEKKLPTGLGGTAPHVDVWMETVDGSVAIESKLLEYFPEPNPPLSKVTDGLRYPRRRTAGGECWKPARIARPI